jgi:phosphoribosyl-dephospho-CoA transferase
VELASTHDTRSVKAHDLVCLRDPATVCANGPDWARAARARSRWAVVRRERAPVGILPIGIRGTRRSERWGTTVSQRSVVELLRPEDLVRRIDQLRSNAPAAQALLTLRSRLHQLPMPWGPTGSAGFELASGLPTLSAESDLDIVVRCPGPPPDRTLVSRVHALLDGLPVHIDAQLDLDVGAVALEELLSGTDEVLAKTPAGPALVPASICWTAR